MRNDMPMAGERTGSVSTNRPMSAEEVREAAAKIAEASGNTPRTIASLIRAMPLTK